MTDFILDILFVICNRFVAITVASQCVRVKHPNSKANADTRRSAKINALKALKSSLISLPRSVGAPVPAVKTGVGVGRKTRSGNRKVAKRFSAKMNLAAARKERARAEERKVLAAAKRREAKLYKKVQLEIERIEYAQARAQRLAKRVETPLQALVNSSVSAGTGLREGEFVAQLKNSIKDREVSGRRLALEAVKAAKEARIGGEYLRVKALRAEKAAAWSALIAKDFNSKASRKAFGSFVSTYGRVNGRAFGDALITNSSFAMMVCLPSWNARRSS